jgi:hypothetical protein
MIISFGWTSEAFCAGKKTVTRRDWPDSHARKFKVGAIVTAWSKQPCYRGARIIGKIEIVSIERESLRKLLTDSDYGREELVREGSLRDTVEEFVSLFDNRKHGNPYRVEFRVVELTGDK